MEEIMGIVINGYTLEQNLKCFAMMILIVEIIILVSLKGRLKRAKEFNARAAKWINTGHDKPGPPKEGV